MEKNNLKKTIYLILSVILWALISFIVYGILTLMAIRNQGCPFLDGNIHFFNLVYSPFPEYVIWLFLFAGAYIGYFIGLRWWQWVYIEKKHWRHWRKK